MSEPKAVSLHDVGKMYKIYPSRLDAVLDTTGLSRFMPWHKAIAQEFWALRNIDLEVKKGERLGIIGRNGAGKSTLLKLLTGNLSPTEGSVEVNGSIQALLTAGAGFHPEFTGIENIQSSLTYQGQTPEEIARAVAEIAEFTELGDFLSQPFKVYSAGMQARLTFATATVLNPDILIVDEILGAGDAYFFGKSMERMKNLVLSGATVLIVSHALDQIARFCERAIWIDRGRVVYSGPAMDTIRVYEEHIHKLEDRRLQAKNRIRSIGTAPVGQGDILADSITIVFKNGAVESDAYVDVSKVELFENQVLFESLRVGDVQDSNTSQSMFTILSGSSRWTRPMREGLSYYRRLNGKDGPSIGSVGCYFYFIDPDIPYRVEFHYRSNYDVPVEVWVKGEKTLEVSLQSTQGDWALHKVPLGKMSSTTQFDQTPVLPVDVGIEVEEKITRWPGEGKIAIDKAMLLDGEDNRLTVCKAGAPMKLEIQFSALEDNNFRVIPAAVLFRIDGVQVSQFIGEPVTISMHKGEQRKVRLCFDAIQLGNGYYTFSVALYQQLDFANVAKPILYDLIDRSYEFQVVGNPPLLTSIINLPSDWKYL